ncbi:threonine synthase [Halarchaeum acidiphilum MH1-52-1]|uniref:Threonine synthase n=1 Tax=Halarchaeum acidiphilum MH1-52-1 TaxID=1261545 RepID=U2YYR7_9EURY|nr:threonine synthase [Halarchaeum acidiphilum MH1-52-1]
MLALACRACGRTYEAGASEPWRCECGMALDFAETPRPSGGPDIDATDGLWAFADLLPTDAAVTLGEGFTPLAGTRSSNSTTSSRRGATRIGVRR